MLNIFLHNKVNTNFLKFKKRGNIKYPLNQFALSLYCFSANL